MLLLHPWMLLGLILVPVATLLHVLRVPGRRHEVSSLTLWQRVLTRVRADAAQRKRNVNWLLLVEILIITLLVVGLSGPVIRHRKARRHIGIILDTSASMNTLGADGRSRWEEARGRVDDLFAQLSDDDRISLYAGPSPQITMLNAEAGAIRRKLTQVAPDDVAISPKDLLADGLAALGEAPQTIVLISDNPPETEDVERLTVGGPTTNVGIVGTSAEEGEGGLQVFVRVRNAGTDAVTRPILVDAGAGWRSVGEVTIAPEATAEKVTPVEAANASMVLHVKLGGNADGLAADDEVALVRAPLPVVAVGEKISPAYAKLFGGSVFENTLYLETDRTERAGAGEAALLIGVKTVPAGLGTTTVLIDPPAGEVLGVEVGQRKALPSMSAPTGEPGPLTRSVDWRTLKLAHYRPLEIPESADVLVRVNGEIVGASVTTREGTVIILGFDPAESLWALEQSFVVFWTNIYTHARDSSNVAKMAGMLTGDVVRLPASDEGAKLTGPHGEAQTVAAVEGGATVRLRRAGVYTWSTQAATRTIGVNLLADVESMNALRADANDNDKVALPPTSVGGAATPIGQWLALLAAFLVILWWYLRP